MNYLLNKDELLDLARKVFDVSIDNYMDLREQTCEQIIEVFLANKKIHQQSAHLTVGSISQSSFGSGFLDPLFGSSVITLTDGSVTDGSLNVRVN